LARSGLNAAPPDIEVRDVSPPGMPRLLISASLLSDCYGHRSGVTIVCLCIHAVSGRIGCRSGFIDNNSDAYLEYGVITEYYTEQLGNYLTNTE